jgi:hypothetical protein
MKTKKSGTVVAVVCLYGNRETGAGWLAETAEGVLEERATLLGTGDPVQGQTFTDAIWKACAAIRSAITTRPAGGRGVVGLVVVFEPGGGRFAVTALDAPMPFGSLSWEPAPVYEFKLDDLAAAAESAAEGRAASLHGE